MTSPDTQHWFESLWADREERLYRQFFGTPSPQIHALPESVFHSLGKPDPDPRFLTHTVLEYPPTDARPHWLYATSGMSNPWGESPATINPQEYSGLGFEFTLHAPAQARWPIHILHQLMAIQLLVATGELQGHLLERADRIPLGAPLLTPAGQLTWLLVASREAGTYPPQFQLASGKVDFLLLLGITAREADFAKTQGDEPLLTLLRHHDVFPITDPARVSLV